MTQQPNIILILVDDMGWMDLTCQGSRFYETPNIDRLANEGMLFTDAYAACPVCSPTRASILSGKYPARVGVTQFIGGAGRGKLLEVPYVDHLEPSNHTLASALGDGGYQTWHVGKWHLGAEPYWPEHQGFDVNIGGNHVGHPRDGYFAPWKLANLEGDDVPEGTYLDDHLGDRAVDLIQQRDADRPFYLNMWFYLVHTPIQAPQELVEKYRQKAEAMGLNDDEALIEGELHPVEHKKNKHVMRRQFQSNPTYAAMIEKLDQNVGKLLDTLDELGIADDTVVMFTSDNGGLSTSEGSPTCNFPLREGKGWMEEGGVREPMLVRWPGTIAPGSKSDAYMTSPDFYPTCLEIAGLDPIPDQHIDGMSFVPALRGEPFERGPIYWHYPHYSNQGSTPAAAIREGDFKLIEFFEDNHVELFNLRDDIGETNNLADQMPQRAFAMQQQLEDWRVDVEALIPEPNPDYVPPTDPAADPTV